MLDEGEDPPSIDYDELPLFAGFISDASGARVASAFLLRVGVQGAPWDRYYSHAYIVTALHAVYDKFEGKAREGCSLEFPWMEEQGLGKVSLDGYRWAFRGPSDLPGQETALDLAVAPLERSAFTGLQFGRSARAVDVDMCELDIDYGILGRETVSVGLFAQHDGGVDRIEPILRFGRVAAVPKGVLNTSFGRVRSILIESASAEGMSGAPVFSRDRAGAWWLLGVHTGHYNTHHSLGAGGDASTVGVHTVVGFVAPADRLVLDLVYGEELTANRYEIDSEIDKYPWRFVDRRHRESRGVVLHEAYFEDMVEYVESGASRHSTYLFYRLQVSGGFDSRFFRGDELEWNIDIHAPLGAGPSVVKSIEAICGPVLWKFRELRLWRGTFGSKDAATALDVYLDDRAMVFAFAISSEGGEIDVETLDALRGAIGHRPLKIIDLARGWEV